MEQRLIDANRVNDYVLGYVDLRDVPTVLTIPERPTNGDMQLTLYSNAKIIKTNGDEIGLRPKGQNWIIWFKQDWWNAPYKGAEHDKRTN